MDSPPQQAAYAKTVALQQCDSQKRGDGVKCNRAANVDKSKTYANNASEQASILRNATFLVDMGNPAGKWKSLVASKGEEVATDGGKVGNV